jgi:hypothetical protein
MMGSIIDRRELGTRKRVDASMIATTSGWLCTVGALPGCSGHSFAESQNDVETSISALLALSIGFLGMALLPFCWVIVVFTQLP